MEKNEAFRKQVLSRLYGLPDPAELPKQDSDTVKSVDQKDGDADEKNEERALTDITVPSEIEKDISKHKTDKEKEIVAEINNEIETDQSNNNEDDTIMASNSYSSKSITTNTTHTTTTSHLYSVLMAPLEGHTPFRENALQSGVDHDNDSGPRKRLRLDNSTSDRLRTEQTAEGKDQIDAKTTTNVNNSVGVDLTKNQKRKLKKKKRKLNKLEVQRAKDFIYSSENEQYSVEKLRTMIEDVAEFLDAIWDVYCSEARSRGESVEEDGYRAAAVLKCLSASGEGSWRDLQLLSRAKSVLVLRSKNLAASTISQVENELGYEADIRNFIVRMLKFWMEEIVTKG